MKLLFMAVLISLFGCSDIDFTQDVAEELPARRINEPEFTVENSYYDSKLNLNFEYLTKTHCGGCWLIKKVRISTEDSVSIELNFNDDFLLYKYKGADKMVQTSFHHQLNRSIKKLDLGPEQVPPFIFIIFNKLMNFEFVQPTDRMIGIQSLIEELEDKPELIKNSKKEMNILFDDLVSRGFIKYPNMFNEMREFDLYNLYDYKTFYRINYNADSITTQGVFSKYYSMPMY